jgi:PAS domain S-box-containing protein
MLTSANAVRRAIEDDQILPVFQPIVNLRTGLVSGFEVLARWKHPRRGLILPKGFINLTERLGLIDVLTEKVLRKAFIAAGSYMPLRMLNVNISPLQLRNHALPGRIRELCRETGWPPSQVTIEITESAIIHNVEMASDVTTELKSMGCGLALDDFGTGYSSLIHLQALRFDELKIDRGFVSEMVLKRESRKIVGAVIELAHNLGLRTVAEGVEDQEHCEMLFRMGCHSGQGWLFGKPRQAHDATGCTQCPVLGNCAGLCTRQELDQTSLDLAASDQAAQLKALYNGAPVGLCLLDKQMRFVSINRYLAKINGLSVQEHLGKTVQEVIPGVFPKFEREIRAALGGAESTSVEVNRGARGDGPVHVLVNHAPVRDEAGEVIGVSIALLDVTARVQAENALSLRAKRFRAMLEHCPFSPWSADAEMNMVEVSPKWLSMTGMTEKDCMGLGWMQAIHPDDLEMRARNIWEAMQTRRPFEAHYRVRSANEGWRWVCSRGWPMLGPGGEVTGWSGYLVDVEEQGFETERMLAFTRESPFFETRSGVAV